MRGQKGFTLMELLAVMAILGILAGLVASVVGGLSGKGRNARLEGDRDTIGKAADRFFNDSFPSTYPVLAFNKTEVSITVAGDLGVRLIDFDARLPQNPTQTFVSGFLKDIPDSAALVSWRIDTKTGKVFFARDGAQLVKPSTARLNVSTANTYTGMSPDYALTLAMKKNEAAVKGLTAEIPAGYSIGGQSLPANTGVGILLASFDTDNPWDPGQQIIFTGTLKTTGIANSWVLQVPYDVNSSTSGATNVNVKNLGTSTRNHTLTVTTPSADTPGRLTLVMDQATDPEQNEATERWLLILYGIVGSGNIITNPSTAGVYRWLAEGQTTIDVESFFDSIDGNQAVVLRPAPPPPTTIPESGAPAYPPMLIFGSIRLDTAAGPLAPAGVTVRARIVGLPNLQFSCSSQGTGAFGLPTCPETGDSYLRIPTDNLTTSTREGALHGETIELLVGSQVVDTVTFEIGALVQKNLVVSLP